MGWQVTAVSHAPPTSRHVDWMGIHTDRKQPQLRQFLIDDTAPILSTGSTDGVDQATGHTQETGRRQGSIEE